MCLGESQPDSPMFKSPVEQDAFEDKDAGKGDDESGDEEPDNQREAQVVAGRGDKSGLGGWQAAGDEG